MNPDEECPDCGTIMDAYCPKCTDNRCQECGGGFCECPVNPVRDDNDGEAVTLDIREYK